jgi:hypothetical protein
MPDDKNRSLNQSGLEQLGQFTYSFFTDEYQNSAAVTRPANAQPQGIQSPAGKLGASESAEINFVHPAEQTRLNEELQGNEAGANQTYLGAKYQTEFEQSYLQAATAASSACESAPPVHLSLAGAVEREAKAGFSAHFNLRLSLERIFRQLDVNHDRRLSKDELGLVYADGRFTGDDELLVILLLHNLDEIRKTGSNDSRGVTFDDILSYPNWKQYLPANYKQYTWLQAKTSDTSGCKKLGTPSSMSFRRNTNR